MTFLFFLVAFLVLLAGSATVSYLIICKLDEWEETLTKQSTDELSALPTEETP